MNMKKDPYNENKPVITNGDRVRAVAEKKGPEVLPEKAESKAAPPVPATPAVPVFSQNATGTCPAPVSAPAARS